MRIKKIAAIIIAVLSIVISLASLAGIIAVWVQNQAVQDRLLAATAQTSALLTLADGSLSRTESEINQVLAYVDLVNAAVLPLMPEPGATQGVLTQINLLFDDHLNPLVQDAHQVLEDWSEKMRSLQVKLSELKILPFLEIKLPGGEQLEAVEQSLQNIDDSVTQIEQGFQKTQQAAKAIERFTLNYNDFKSDMEELQADIGVSRQAIEDFQFEIYSLEAKIPAWVDSISWLVTLFLALLLLSQVAVFILAWSVYTGQDLIKNWRK